MSIEIEIKKIRTGVKVIRNTVKDKREASIMIFEFLQRRKSIKMMRLGCGTDVAFRDFNNHLARNGVENWQTPLVFDREDFECAIECHTSNYDDFVPFFYETEETLLARLKSAVDDYVNDTVKRLRSFERVKKGHLQDDMGNDLGVNYGVYCESLVS